jgi:exonuclease VII small subunit
MSDQYNELVSELVRVVRELEDNNERIEHAVDKLEQRFADALNRTYQQGVRDATKARTGHDPEVESDA